MKIQLDTKAKTITIEESANLGALMETIEKILPEQEWKQYKLEPKILFRSMKP